MTITQLEYIIAVDTYKGFGEAAKRCFVTQPTLSMQIKKLEEDLGIIIFDRSKKPVLTTDIGRQIIEQAKIGLKELKRIHEIIEYEKGRFSGTIRVGIIPTLSPYLVPRFATFFVKKYPKVQLVIEELLSNDIIRKLQDDLLDVGIMVAKEYSTGLVKIPIFYEEFLLYFASNHQLSRYSEVPLDQLHPNEMWLLKEGHCFRDQIQNFCGEQFFKQSNKTLAFESGSLETLKKIVDQEFGYTLLPELATLELNGHQQKNVRRFKGQKPVREVSFILHRSFLKEKLITALKDEIQKRLPKTFLERKGSKVVPWIKKKGRS